MAEKGSWKLYLLIGFVVLFISSFAFFFTSFGMNTMKGMMDSSYNDAPPAERISLPAADKFLTLAFYRGSILMDREGAMEMYREFLGIQTTEDGKDFFDVYNSTKKTPWSGKFEGDRKTGYTGWGILHPRACEAYNEYLQLLAQDASKQRRGEEAIRYHTLFYVIYPKIAKSKGRTPHPKFYVYWEKIDERLIQPARLSNRPKPKPKPAGFEGPAK